MLQNNQASQPGTQATGSLQATGKVKLDLLVLGAMAQSTHIYLLNLAAGTSFPLVDYIERSRKRIHRIVVYNRQEILLKSNLVFVGFVSRIQEHVSPAIIQELHRVDKLLITELANHTGLLSYSSLELHKDHWYNLVLLSDYAAKTYFKDNSTHRYAAHQLATHFYAWIRLHNGVMPGGLVYNQLILQRTKYYTFPEIGQKPVMWEVLYDGVTCSGSPLFSAKRSSDK
jgi:hypothetical protein